MPKIDRYNGNLKAFASEQQTNERTLFGQTAIANDLTSQVTAQFLRGWGIVGPSDQPSLQDFNAAMYTNGQLLAYLHQMGVAEFNADQEYYIGSVTQAGGDIYISLQNNNTGRAPASNPTWWRNPSGAATATVRGGVILASQPEATAGTENTKAMTSLRVKQAIDASVPVPPPAATEVVPGLTRYSTSAEVQAGAGVSAATKPDQVKALFDSGALFGGVQWVNTDGLALATSVIGSVITTDSNVNSITAPPSASIRVGGTFTVHNLKGASGNLTINRAGTDVFSMNGSGLTSITLKPSEYAMFYKGATGIWYVIGSISTSSISLGIDQTYIDVKASRVSGVTYTNNTGRPIFVTVGITSGSISAVCNGVPVQTVGFAATFIVPAGFTYSVTATSSITSWAEMR